MKVVAPKSFTYSGGNKAVLLLHGFTGNAEGFDEIAVAGVSLGGLLALKVGSDYP